MLTLNRFYVSIGDYTRALANGQLDSFSLLSPEVKEEVLEPPPPYDPPLVVWFEGWHPSFRAPATEPEEPPPPPTPELKEIGICAPLFYMFLLQDSSAHTGPSILRTPQALACLQNIGQHHSRPEAVFAPLPADAIGYGVQKQALFPSNLPSQ